MISVIMSTYKEPIEYLEQSINSILNQSYKDLEFIIFIDNPENREHINYIKEVEQCDRRIKLFINEKNLGLVGSLNNAIVLAKGDYIARMDADDIAELDRLECQLSFMTLNDYDLVGCNIRDIDEKGNFIRSKGTNFPTSDRAIKKFLKTNSAIPHPTWLVKKTVYQELGYYVDFPACEDYEFLTRAALDGKKLGNLSEIKLRYRINSEGISSKKKIIQKTSLCYLKKNYNIGNKSNLDDFFLYLSSEDGKMKQKNLMLYYERSCYLKELYKKNEWLDFFICGINVFVNSGEGRNVVFSVLKEKIGRLMP